MLRWTLSSCLMTVAACETPQCCGLFHDGICSVRRREWLAVMPEVYGRLCTPGPDRRSTSVKLSPFRCLLRTGFNNPMNHKLQGLVGLHLSVLLLGGTALFSKLIKLSAVDITALRSVFAALALLGLLLMRRRPLQLQRGRDYLMVLLLGVLFGVHWITYFHAMQVSTVAVGLIALYTFPVITVFLEPWFAGQRPHYQDVLSGLLVILGIYLMVPAFDLADGVTQGVLWGVFSALLFALRNVLQRHYFTHYSAPQALFYQSVVVAVLVLPFLSGEPQLMEGGQWGLVVLLGIVFTALPHTLFANGLIHFKAKTASLVACLQVVYATGFAALLLDELPDWHTLLGGSIIVCAAAYESVRANR